MEQIVLKLQSKAMMTNQIIDRDRYAKEILFEFEQIQSRFLNDDKISAT